MDGNPSYPTVIEELKQKRVLGSRCRCRIVPYLNSIVEQDHRAIKRRINASLGFRSFDGAKRTIQGYEAMHMIRKGQVRWLSKSNIAAQLRFIQLIFGLAAAYPHASPQALRSLAAIYNPSGKTTLHEMPI